jgi:anaerobic ribonucleoside-triphosphate reductase activating protein
MPLAQPQSGGEAVDVDVLFKQIQEQKETIEGVTFLGGEPFEQAEALSYIAQKVQCMGLSVLTFTGYKYETLLGLNNKHVNKLLANTDLLIDGEFQEQNLDYSRPWVGSSNQRYLLLTKNTAGVILGYKKSV